MKPSVDPHTIESVHGRLVEIEKALPRKAEFSEDEDELLRELIRFGLFLSSGKGYATTLLKWALGAAAAWAALPEILAKILGWLK